jgi:hypothetical protein
MDKLTRTNSKLKEKIISINAATFLCQFQLITTKSEVNLLIKTEIINNSNSDVLYGYFNKNNIRCG